MQITSSILWALLLVSADAKRHRHRHLRCTRHRHSTSTGTDSIAQPTAEPIVSATGGGEDSRPTEVSVSPSTFVSVTLKPSGPSSTATSAGSESTSKLKPTTSATSTSKSPSSTSSSSSSSSSSTKASAEPTSHPRAYPADSVDKLRDSSIKKLSSHLERNPADGCTLENAAVRYEWSDLSVSEREDYIKAVRCLMNKPAKTPANVAAGAKSRYDDFVVTHIQQTNSIHNTAKFLSWHRYYTWAYETALRDECGYKGYQPYWNWDRYADDPVNSPLFDGSSSSLGGNSVNGACADAGPFEELNVNVGPGSSLRYNPRCLKRDISRSNAQQCTADKTLSLITGSRDVKSFQDTMQSPWGVHAGGHFTIGGDPGGDIFVSPGDPAFYLHHAMIDRVWWIWQLQDLDSRLTAVAGSVAGSNRQGSRSDRLNLGVSGAEVALGDLLDTMGGKSGDFCYIYM